MTRPTHAMLGSLSFQHGDCAAAIEHFERSLPLVQKSEEAQRELGSCLFSQGDHRKAEETFRRIAEQDPSEKNLLATRGGANGSRRISMPPSTPCSRC